MGAKEMLRAVVAVIAVVALPMNQSALAQGRNERDQITAGGDSDGVGGIPPMIQATGAGDPGGTGGGSDGSGNAPLVNTPFVRFRGDPGGSGSVPPAGGGATIPTTMNRSVLHAVGRVVDARGVDVARLGIVVTSSRGEVMATGMTDSDGFFILSLPVAEELELAVLGTGVAEVPVQAGEAVLILLP